MNKISSAQILVKNAKLNSSGTLQNDKSALDLIRKRTEQQSEILKLKCVDHKNFRQVVQL